MGTSTGERVLVFQAPVIDGVRMGHVCGQLAILSVLENAQNMAKLQYL